MDRKELYRKLTAEKKRLEEELAMQASQASDAERRGGPYGNKEDDASEVTDMERRFAMEERLKGSLNEIEKALNKWEAGEYGTCENCQKEIEPARLEAFPQASLCLKCKAALAKDGRGKVFR